MFLGKGEIKINKYTTFAKLVLAMIVTFSLLNFPAKPVKADMNDYQYMAYPYMEWSSCASTIITWRVYGFSGERYAWAEIEKCDGGNFIKNGTVKIILISTGEVMAQTTFSAGASRISLTFDPYGDHDVIGNNDYEVRLYPDGDPNTKITDSIEVWAEFATSVEAKKDGNRWTDVEVCYETPGGSSCGNGYYNEKYIADNGAGPWYFYTEKKSGYSIQLSDNSAFYDASYESYNSSWYRINVPVAGMDVVVTYVTDSNPILQVDPSTLTFNATEGGGNPASQSLSISNSGTGILNWTANDNASWISLSSTSGTAPATVNVSVNIEGLSVGTFNGQITISSSGAQNSPQEIPVTLTIDEAPPSAVDLRPTNISTETLPPFFAGSTVGLQASVKNNGTVSAGRSVLGYYISDSSSGPELEAGTTRTNTVPALSAGSSSTLLYEDVYIPIDAQVGTTYYAVFEADIDNDVAESDESNNKASKPLTVQACDTSAMYCDVPPEHTFREEVEALRNNISNGCSSRANIPYQNAVFCPEMLLDRASMAVFAVRRRLGYNPTLGTYQGYFIDVSKDTPFALWIEKAYELDIVEGCEGSTPHVDLKYCPNYDTSGWAGIVTRAQMAVFLHRTEVWDLSQPPTGVFDDVKGDNAENKWERAVEYMWWQGYIHGVPPEIGCQNSNPSGDLIYCGSDYVNRGTAAGFMSRAFGYVTTIKGYVRDSDNNGIDGVTINFSGGYGSVETSHGGFYHHTGFPNGTYTLTPSKSGYSFTPSSATVSATGGSVTQDFVGNLDTSVCSASEIDAYLASKNSPLKGWGNVLVAKGQQYNVDPRLVVAIAGTESTFAKNGACALSRYNAWGYGGGWPKCKDFGSWESAIDRVTWQLWQYKNVRGLNNIHQIGLTWCGSGCQHWEPNTRAFYAEQGGNPDSSDLSFGGACEAPTCPQSGGGILYQNIGFDCNEEPLGYGYVEQPEPGWQNIPSSFDNKASSIKLPTGWSAKLFQGTNRGNSWICFNESDSNFTDDVFNNGESLDNEVSSFELFSHSNCDQTAINDIVSAARAQIGVPYSAKRHPYCGTWGPWRAKYSVCTDLVIDAYLLGTGGTGCGGSCNDGWWGAMECHIGGTNIEALLRQDSLDNPGRYRWRSARNAEDMRQYFYHNQTYLDGNTDWQAGDIVFFDWHNDGIADHVGIISEVSGDGPTRIVQSTGSGSRFEECKSGACEVDWDKHFQEGTAAHGRIAASYQLRSHSTETQTTEALRLILQTNDPLLMLTLHNPEGKWVNQRMDMSLVANNNENFIPYIPYNNISWINNTQSITIYNPLTGTYQALITSTASSSFTLEIAIVKDGEIQQVSQHFGNVMPSNSWGTIIEVSRSGQQTLRFDVIPDSVTENLVLPSMLTLSVKTNSMGQNSFVISTTSTYSVSVESSTLYSQIGEEYPYENVQITPAEFTSYAGISHIVYLTATAPSQAIAGQYLGMLKITLSFDDRDLSYNIPLQINYIDTEKFIYLPVVLRAYTTY